MCTVRIRVLDRNDNAPRLDRVPEQIELGDDAKAGSILGQLEAKDPDEGQNGKVLFLLEGDPSGMFDLDPVSGELILARQFGEYYSENF